MPSSSNEKEAYRRTLIKMLGMKLLVFLLLESGVWIRVWCLDDGGGCDDDDDGGGGAAAAADDVGI